MSDFWVFGYGSLMWRPGFDHVEAVPALLKGLHRALCVYSWVHRGTRERPGLVLGLDRGGSCRGTAYRVDGAKRDEVITYLRERELITDVYHEDWRLIQILSGQERPVSALAYRVDRRSQQYAGKLTREEQLAFVKDSVGRAGANADYVINTAKHLREVGVHDPTLDWLAGELDSKQRA